MLAMRQTAEMMRDVSPEPADVIINDSYVDDICHSMDEADKSIPLMTEIEDCLAEGGFKIKNWILSGSSEVDEDIKLPNSDYEKVLDLVWRPKEDELKFKVRINFSLKVRKIRSGPDIREEEVLEKVPGNLTKREALSQISSIYDPLGLITPALMKGKLLMCELISYEDPVKGKLGWDDYMPNEMKEKWCNFFHKIFAIQDLAFSRSLKLASNHYIYENPSLVIFSDGSMQAFGAAAYII